VHERSDQTTQQLVLRSKAGDLAAFDQLIRGCQSYAYSIAVRLLCDEDEAEDVVQQSFIRVWKHIGRFDQRRKFTTWLYKIVTNLCLDRLKATRRRSEVFSPLDLNNDVDAVADEQSLDQIQTNEEMIRLVKALTGRLPAKQKLVFVLRDLEDLPMDEVSEITGLSVGSIKTNLHYARRTIRSLMEREYNIKSVEL
jgi:RNA polymerase sigma-70 factor (ECF subfamily)